MVNKSKSEEEIYSAALKIPTDERSAYVKAACGDDSELLERVESLLQIRQSGNNFLESGPFIDTPLMNSLPEEKAGANVGRYKLLEKIGEGGMAAVYMAEQKKPLHRKVALKIIKLGMDTKSVIARFEVERQALAMMEHPNIAKVLDAGSTETGRPYFVMELVKGNSITDYCDKNKLSTRERLDLFIQVCNAVQHAHLKGIIHRDIKPSNVMITLRDGKAVPKVIDFGIAKATSQRLTEKTLFTRYAQMIGTPAYMSPEQAEFSEIDIDTRTDIYSLGVLLYELLTGATPLDEVKLREAGYLEMQRIILEEEPTKPSTKLSTLGDTVADIAEQRKASPDLLQKLIRGDLDWIVMKSLEKDRTRRYDTVVELAADVQRHLRNEPVQAAAPSVSYRLRKFIRRNRVAVMVGSLVALVVLVAVSALSVSTIMIWREKARTEAQANRAEANLSLALEALDEIYLEVAKERLPEKVEIEEADRELLQRALVFYERFAEQNQTVVEARYKTARAYTRAGDIHHTLGDYEQAIEAYRKAHQAFEKLVEEFPEDPNYQKELAECNIHFGMSYYRLDRYEEAEQVFRRAINLAKKLVAKFGNVPSYRNVLAGSYSRLGVALQAKAELDRAQKAGRNSLAIYKKLIGEFPNAREYRSGLASSYINLGNVLLGDKGEFDEAEQTYRSGLTIYEELTRQFPNVPEYQSELARVQHNLGVVLSNKGELDNAEQAYGTAIAINEELAREFPSMPEYRSNLALTNLTIGTTLERKGELDKAEQAFRSAIAIREKLAREFSHMPGYRWLSVASYHLMGGMLITKGKLDEGEQALSSAIVIGEELIREFPKVPGLRQHLIASLQYLGDMLKDRGEPDEAVEAYRKAVIVGEELSREFPNKGGYRPHVIASLHSMGSILSARGDLDEAVEAYRKAVVVQEKLVRGFPDVPEYRLELAHSHDNIGDMLKDKGELDEAGQAYRSASAILKELVAEFPEVSEYQERLGWSYNNLAWYLVTFVDPQLRDAGRAVELAQEAVEAAPEKTTFWNTLGIAHYRAGDWQATVEDLDKSIQLQKDGGNSWQWFFLAMAHWQLGEKDEARQLYYQAVEWMEQKQRFNKELYHFRAEAAQLLGIIIKTNDREPPLTGKQITSMVAKASGSHLEAAVASVLDGSGLGDNDNDGLLEHDTNVKHMWLSEKGQTSGWVEFDVGSVYRLGSILVWNYNEKGSTNRGVKRADISVWAQSMGWQKILDDFEFTEAEGNDDYDEPVLIKLEGARAQKVRFDDLVNLGDEEYIGLAEVKVFEVRGSRAIRPQPADGIDVGAAVEAKLSWTPGLDVSAHNVYLGTDPTHLNLLAKLTGDVTCEVKLPKLEKFKWYCWRVDAVKSDGAVVKGNLWSFSKGNMVGWWKFERAEGRKVMDSSGNGLNGRLVGDAHIISDPERGHVLSLDGDGDYVDFGDDRAFDITDAFTITCWIKANEPFVGAWRTIVSKGDSAWRLQAYSQMRSVCLHCAGIDSSGHLSNFGGVGGVEGTIDADDGKWHHVVSIYDKATACIYVDGVLDKSEDASGTIDTNVEPVYIGANSEGPRLVGHLNCWNGLIDDVRIYSYALTDAEVKELYVGRGPGPLEKPEWIVEVGSGDYTPSVSGEAAELLNAGDMSMPNGKEVVPEKNE